MKIYIMLPFTNVTYLNDCNDNKSANLTDDYEINFKTTSRYKYQGINTIDFRRPSFGNPEKSYRWVYTIINPKTFHIYQGG